MNLIQQLAEYQNAPIQSLEAAKKGANPAISPWVAGAILSDRIEKQKRMGMAQGAAQGEQETVSDQQDQELQGIMQAMAPQGAGQAQAAPQEAPVMAAGGGLMQARVNPGMFDYCGGGIIAFDEGGEVDDEVRDPVTGALISGGETRRGENQTVREALGIGNKENRLALERAEEDQRKANAPKKARDPQEAEILRLAAEVARGGAGKGEIQDRAEFDRRRGVNASGAPGGGAKAPAGGGAAKDSGLMALLTSSPEWADLDAARKRQFEAPKIGQTAGELAAEKAAHLKAQGITEAPWEASAKQTAALRDMLKTDDAEQAAKREASQGRSKTRRIIENMGAGSFGASGAQGLRAETKYQDEMDAEDRRRKQLRFEQNLKLNEIDAKSNELRYNEAIGDVAAAQKNRKEIAELQRSFEKDKVAIAQGQAGIRERGLASQLSADTQLKAANIRAANAGGEDKNRINSLKTMATTLKGQIDKTYKKDEKQRLQAKLDGVYAELAQIAGIDSTMGAPSAAGAGGKSSGKWGQAQVVK